VVLRRRICCRFSAPGQAPAVGSGLEREYTLAATIGGNALSAFRESLLDVAVGDADQVVALGDGHVRVFTPAESRTAVAARATGRVPDSRRGPQGLRRRCGRVEVFEADGRRAGGFAFGDAAKPPSLSAIAVRGPDILVAGRVGADHPPLRRGWPAAEPHRDQGKTKTFMLPNGRLDLDVDAAGSCAPPTRPPPR